MVPVDRQSVRHSRRSATKPADAQVTRVGAFRQRLQDHLGKPRRRQLGRERRLPRNMPVDDVQRIRTVEGHFAGQEPKKDDAQGIDVGAMVDGVLEAAGLLR